MLGRELPVDNQIPWFLPQRVSSQPEHTRGSGLPWLAAGSGQLRDWSPRLSPRGRAAPERQQDELFGAAGPSQRQA